MDALLAMAEELEELDEEAYEQHLNILDTHASIVKECLRYNSDYDYEICDIERDIEECEEFLKHYRSRTDPKYYTLSRCREKSREIKRLRKEHLAIIECINAIDAIGLSADVSLRTYLTKLSKLVDIEEQPFYYEDR
ncbi:MAG: hypothetical protein R3Y56_03360 [Akkermansia sp.]